MFAIFLFLFLFSITQGFIVLEEETLILLAGLFWVDLAGSLFRESLESELVFKADAIKDKFVFVLKAKETSLTTVCLLHRERLFGFTDDNSYYNQLHASFIFDSLKVLLLNIHSSQEILKKSSTKEMLVSSGFVVLNDYFFKKLEPFLSKIQ